MKSICLLLVVLLLSTACSSVKSTRNVEMEPVIGLAYYMPKKDFKATLVRTGDANNGQTQTLTLGTTAAYPDFSAQYVLNYSRNLVGKNVMDIEIGPNGLLTKAHSATTNQIDEVFKGLAGIAGYAASLKNTQIAAGECEIAGSDTACDSPGTHTFVFSEAEKCYTFCGIRVDINSIPVSADAGSTGGSEAAVSGPESGVYYRQNLPYLMTARGDTLSVTSIVFSPSRSHTHFLPIAETFFANNSAELGFVDGVPTKWKQDTDGELVGLLKLPADIIGAYFAAVGEVFTSFSSRDSQEAAAIANSLALELAKKKYDACITAIKEDNAELIQSLACIPE